MSTPIQTGLDSLGAVPASDVAPEVLADVEKRP
ncbi:hypothetical protein QFZ60_002192 [Arthrobacter sp. B2I5]|nr:hypothetical protein [Arthrobacter sp. B2I5]